MEAVGKAVAGAADAARVSVAAPKQQAKAVTASAPIAGIR